MAKPFQFGRGVEDGFDDRGLRTVFSVETHVGQVAIVLVERSGYGSQVCQGQAQGQGQRQVGRQVGLAVEMAVQPSAPLVFEFDAGQDLVADLEGRRQAGLKGSFAQQAAGESVESTNVRLVQVRDTLVAAGAFHLVTLVVVGRFLQLGANAIAQLGGGGFGEGDGSDAVQGGGSGGNQVGHSLDEAGGFSSAGAGLDKKRRAQVFSDGFPDIGIDGHEGRERVSRSCPLR